MGRASDKVVNDGVDLMLGPPRNVRCDDVLTRLSPATLNHGLRHKVVGDELSGNSV
ncbi:MAG: hypothetical protein ACJAYU_002925 [Bradymonadia bacterium]|jgi:hypothetical protein